MLHAGLKAVFTALSRSPALARFASRYGLATRRGFARRFVAGETIEEAIDASRALEQRGLQLTLDYLGESVTSHEDARAAATEYLRMIDRIVASGIERNLSLKLTQLGLDVDRTLAIGSLQRILDPARRHGFFVRIDMESSAYTDMTLDMFEALWQQGYHNVGVVLQAGLHRTPADVRRMNALGARVRLVKGAYKEPAAVAHQRMRDVNAAFLALMRVLLDEGTYPAIATHDEQLLDDTRAYAAAHGLTADRYEIQLLYGIRRDLQTSLVAAGCRVRVYVPFGQQWFPYFMRRLGERPENLGFVLRGIFGER